jgi:hypothetical protein
VGDMMANNNKRQTDMGGQDEIEELIAQENDPKERVKLLLINRLIISIGEYSKRVDVHITNFDEFTKIVEKHMSEEDIRLNQSKGAWRFATPLLGVAQLVVGWMLVAALDDVKSLHAGQHQLAEADHVIIERIIKLEQLK